MRGILTLGMVLAVGTFALIGFSPFQAIADPDKVVVIQSGALKETVTTVNQGEQVTWVNATGSPAVRVVFDAITGAPDSRGLFTNTLRLTFPRPGEYPYTALNRALPIRGKIVVK